MRGNPWSWTFLIAVLVGCGSSDSQSVTADATRSDALAHEVAASTASYCDGHSWSAGPAACAAAAAAHESAIAPHLREMAGLAPHLDDGEHRAGHAEHADCACTVGDMETEMARHRAAACSGTAAELDAEGARHCEAMMAAAARLHERAGEVSHHPDEWPWPGTGAGASPGCAGGMNSGM